MAPADRKAVPSEPAVENLLAGDAIASSTMALNKAGREIGGSIQR